MRVLFWPTILIPAVSALSVDAVRGLMAQGHEVFALTSGGISSLNLNLPEGSILISVFV